MLEVIKNILSKLGLFNIFRNLFGNTLTDIRSYFFRKNALETFKKLMNILNKENIENFIVFGTLLGAIREKGFIKHDLDIDLGVWNDCNFKNLQNILENNGFYLKSEIQLSNNTSIEYQNYVDRKTKISIDFYKFTRLKNKILYYDFLREENMSYSESIKKNGGLKVYCYEYPLYSLKKINFYDMQCSIFREYDEFLQKHYGDNYMIPIKNFNSREISLKQKYEKNFIGIKKVYK